jgi:amino acid adenylation domain-containing protein
VVELSGVWGPGDIPKGRQAVLDAAIIWPQDPRLVLTRALLVQGDLSEHRLRAALDTLLARHEALRTAVAWLDGRACLQSMPARSIPLCVVDASGREPADLEPEICRVASTVLNIRRAPLAEVHLFRMSVERSLLVFSVHHLICDLTAAGLLLQELFDLLQAPAPSPLPETSHYFAAPALSEPPDFHQPTRLQALWGHIDEPLSRDLRELCRREGVPAASVFLAAWARVVGRHLDNSPVEICLLASGRGRRNLYDVNQHSYLRPRLIEVAPDVGAMSLVRSLAVDHQLAAFKQTSEPTARRGAFVTFGYQKTAGRSEGFWAGFALGLLSEEMAEGCLKVRSWIIPQAYGPGKVNLCVAPSNGTWLWRLDFAASHMGEAGANLLMRHMVQFLRGLVSTPYAPVSAIAMLDEEERAAVAPMRADHPENPCALGELLNRMFAIDPDAPAIWSVDRGCSYGELYAHVQAAERRLAAAGVEAGQRVAVASEPTVLAVATILAILRVGAIFVPIPTEGPHLRAKEMLVDVAPSLVLVSRACAWGDRHVGRILEDWAEQGGDGARMVRQLPSEESAAYVIFTSGSSGRPKGVEVSRANLAAFLAGVLERLGLRAEDRVLLLQPFTFDIAWLEMLAPLRLGGTLVLAPARARREPRTLSELLDRAEVTVMQATPTIWRSLTASGWRPSPRMLCLSGGEPLPPELAAFMLSGGARLWNLYGPTEATVWATAAPITQAGDINLGCPLPGSAVQVLDSDLSPTPLDCVGELWIGGDGVATGYWRDPSRTAAAFRSIPGDPKGRWYRTGDRVRREANGDLRYEGRLDRQMKIAGQRVEPGEIESALRDLGFADAAVVDVDRGHCDAVLVAFVAVGEGNADESQLSRIRDRVPGHMVPSRLFALPRIPVLTNGKRDVETLRARARLALAQPARAELGEEDLVGPLAAAVVRTWSDVLGRPVSDPHASFFELGGSSLQLMSCVARLEANFNVRLALDDVWRRPTVALLAARLSEASREARHSGGPPEKVELFDYPATDVQARIWTAHQFDPGRADYGLPLVIEFEGRLGPLELEAALQDIAAIHTVMNSRFLLEGGAVTAHSATPNIPVSRFVDDGRAVVDWIADYLLLPFDLEQGPLARALWFDRGDEGGMLVLAVHHIVVDGVSLSLLLRDFAERLRLHRSGAARPPRGRSEFATFAHRVAAAPDRSPDVAFWRTRLAGPYWNPRQFQSSADPASGEGGFVIGAECSTRLRLSASAAGLSIFAVMAALVQAAMEEVAVELPLLMACDISRRESLDTVDAVGPFFDQVPLLLEPAPDESLLERARRIQSRLAEAMGAGQHGRFGCNGG